MTPVGSFTIEPGHPSLPGHFPGRPVVPGVVLLDHALLAILAAHGGRVLGLPVVKFTRPVSPGQIVTVACAAPQDGRIAFACTAGGAPVARGSLMLDSLMLDSPALGP